MGPGTAPGGPGGTRLTSLTPEVIDWLASVLGSYPADGVVARLPASTSSILVLGGGQVLRWYDDGRFLEDEPEAIARESAALTALAGSGVPAPRLIAASERAPAALLMTRLAGSPDLDIPDPAAIIDLLEAIHAVTPGPAARWSYHGYHEGRDLARPGWWRDAALWDRAVRQTTTARPHGPGVFIHRDFHPGNLLWSGRALTGIVDWVNACVGPAEVDVAAPARQPGGPRGRRPRRPRRGRRPGLGYRGRLRLPRLGVPGRGRGVAGPLAGARRGDGTEQARGLRGPGARAAGLTAGRAVG